MLYSALRTLGVTVVALSAILASAPAFAEVDSVARGLAASRMPSNIPYPAPYLYQVQVNSPSAYNPEGDSITAGTGASVQGNAFANRMSTDTGITLTNRGIPSEMSCNMTINETTKENPGPSNNALYTILIGTNDSDTKAAGPYEAVFNLCHQAALSWLAIPSNFKTLDNSATLSGTWSINSTPWNQIAGSRNAVTAGATMTFNNVKTFGAPLYFWYFVDDTWGGTFTYTLDGGSPVTVQQTTATPIASKNDGGSVQTLQSGLAMLRIPVGAGTHTFVVTAGSGVTAPVGVGTVPNLVERGAPKVYVGGVPRMQNDFKASDTAAYNADVQANVTLLQSDGLPVYFVDVRAYVNASTEMSDQWHPNDTGHRHMADAFEAVVQPTTTGGFNGTLAQGVQVNQPASAVTNPASTYWNLNTGNVADSTGKFWDGIMVFDNVSLNDYFGIDLAYNQTHRFATRVFATSSHDIVLSGHPETAITNQSEFTDVVTVDLGTNQVGVMTGANRPKATLEVNGTFMLDPNFTVATLPTCTATIKGETAVVTDATSPTYLATLTGGGTTVAPAFCNGSTWVAH